MRYKLFANMHANLHKMATGHRFRACYEKYMIENKRIYCRSLKYTRNMHVFAYVREIRGKRRGRKKN